MKHTKSEWNDNGCGGVWRSGKNWKVADVKAGSGSADMRLILSAPELLEALKNLMAMHSGGKKQCGHDYDCVCPFEQAKQAINKAEGK